MIDIAKDAGASVINADRMWHYTEGLANWNPIWPGHGIRVIPGPSSLWLDATGKRMPPFLFPGCDTLATLKHICSTTYDYTWFILDRAIIAREFSLSGSEQNPDITGKSTWLLLQRIFGRYGTGPVQKFVEHGEDFVVHDTIEGLVEGMNRLAKKIEGPILDFNQVKSEVEARDMQMTNKFSKDAQVMLIQNARKYWPEWLARIATPHKLLGDKGYGPLIAVRLHLLTRKTLGGLETDLSANVLHSDGTSFSGLYAAGEASGFGGGGVHGYNALEGTFLGGCIFSGRTAGRAIADFMTSS
jgi:predicted oxidoreductase